MQRFLEFRWIMILAMVVMLAACGGHVARPSGPPEKPNVVFIRCDDLGRWAVGAMGNKDVVTPNMDRIFSEGATFTNAFVTTPVCSPARAAAISGLHSIQTGIRDWIKEGDKTTGIRSEYVLWPEVFHEAGYKTGFFGKWHIGSAPEHHPTRNGFDFFTGMIERADNRDPELEMDGKLEKREGVWRDEFLAEKAAEFIAGPHESPFLLMVDLRSPHSPYLPVPDQDKAHYENKRLVLPPHPDLDLRHTENQMREYYSAVTYVDRCIGIVIGALDRAKLGDDTILVFTSDHGYMIGHHALQNKGNAVRIDREALRLGLRGSDVRRPNMFDDSLRVPLAIRWPGRIKPGSKVDQMIIQQDFHPSLIALAGLQMPKLPAMQKIQGRDFSPLLMGEKIKWRDTIFGDYDMKEGRKSSMRMIRTSEWKLVRHDAEAGMPDELYDLSSDPGETRNLLESREEAAPPVGVIQRLDKGLKQWQMELDDPLVRNAL